MINNLNLETLDYVFIDRLRVAMSIGIFDFEKMALQEVLLSAKCYYDPGELSAGEYVCYKRIADTMLDIIAQYDHIELVENLAKFITDALFKDKNIKALRLTIEKPQAIFKASSSGLTITRFNPSV